MYGSFCLFGDFFILNVFEAGIRSGTGLAFLFTGMLRFFNLGF